MGLPMKLVTILSVARKTKVVVVLFLGFRLWVVLSASAYTLDHLVDLPVQLAYTLHLETAGFAVSYKSAAERLL